MPTDKHAGKEVEENVYDKEAEELDKDEDLSLEMLSVGSVASTVGDAISHSDYNMHMNGSLGGMAALTCDYDACLFAS